MWLGQRLQGADRLGPQSISIENGRVKKDGTISNDTLQIPSPGIVFLDFSLGDKG